MLARVLLLLLVASGPPKIDDSVVYYEVSGSTARDTRADMDRLQPADPQGNEATVDIGVKAATVIQKELSTIASAATYQMLDQSIRARLPSSSKRLGAKISSTINDGALRRSRVSAPVESRQRRGGDSGG